MPVGPPLDVFQLGGGGGGGVTSINGEFGPLTITGSGGIIVTEPSAQTVNIDGSSIVPAGVSSINTLTGAIVLAAGTNITLTPVGNTITIDATGGVSSLNGETGAVSLVAGANISITPSGSNITIASSAVTGVSSLNAKTGAVTISSSDGSITVNNAGTPIDLTVSPSAGYVTIAGTQTITGQKEFTSVTSFAKEVYANTITTTAANSLPLGRYGIVSESDNQIITLVTAATNASPIAVTVSPTIVGNIQTGQTVTIAGVTGNTAANGTWTVTVTVAGTTFTLDGSTGNGAYTGGGTVKVQAAPNFTLFGGPTATQNCFAAITKNNNITSAYAITTLDGTGRFYNGLLFDHNCLVSTGYAIDGGHLGTGLAMLRLPNNGANIVGRNAADSADVGLLGIDGTNHPVLGMFQIPTADGSAGQLLSTDGSGHLSFVSGASSISLPAKEIAFGSGSNTLTGSANLTWDDSSALQSINNGLNGGIAINSPDTHATIMARDGTTDTFVISNGAVGGYTDQYSILLGGTGGAQTASMSTAATYGFAGLGAFSVVLTFNPTLVDATRRGVWGAQAGSGSNTISFDSTNTYFYVGDSVHTLQAYNQVAGSPLVQGQTNLIVAVYDTSLGHGVRTIYVNGAATSVATGDGSAGTVTNTNCLYRIGQIEDPINALTANGAGYYDNIFGYRRALTSGEAAAIWNGGSLVPITSMPQDWDWLFRFDQTPYASGTYPFANETVGTGYPALGGTGLTISTHQTPLWPASSFVPTASRTVLKHFENPAGDPTLQLGDSATLLSILPTTSTTVGAAGGASALPASPLGYIPISINGTTVKIPYYNS